VFDRVVRAVQAKQSIEPSWVVWRQILRLGIQFLLGVGLGLRNRASAPFQLAAIQGPRQTLANQATKTDPARPFGRGLEGF
jgi:hypothetical protein